jgi:hypothetical protein
MKWPPDEKGVLQQTPISKLPELPQSNSGIGFAQACITAHRARELELLCIAARTLANISERLDDIATLAQQELDLLRRILSQERMP